MPATHTSTETPDQPNAAHDIPFDPSTPADWTGNRPDTVGMGLDEAASLVAASGHTHPIDDNTGLVRDVGDATAIWRLDAGSITGGNTRVLTMRDSDLDLATAVTAAVAFGTDNVLVRADGVGRGAQHSGWLLDDADKLTAGGDLVIPDGLPLYLGTALNYWIEYQAIPNLLRFRTSDSDGIGTDDTFMGVLDGTLVVQFPGSVKVNTVNEYNVGSGVTIDSALVKDGGITLAGTLDLSTNYSDWAEIAAPANPAANVARMYCKDDAGTTKLFFRDSAGTETEMGGGGGGAHAILSATHSDSVANAVTRGSIIYGNSTPKWDELTAASGGQGDLLRNDGTDVAWSSHGPMLEPYFVAIDTPTKLAWNTHLTSGGLPVCGIGIDDNLSGTATLYLAFQVPWIWPGGTPYIFLAAISSEAVKSLDFTVSWECDAGADLDALSLDAEAALTLNFSGKTDKFVTGSRELDAGTWIAPAILYMKIDIADADPPTNIVTLLVPKIYFTN